jgi:starch synthase (maltosyl-transferring)
MFHANVLGRIAGRRAGVRAVASGIRVAERRSRWHLWLDRLTSRWADRYVCVSQSVADFSIVDGAIPSDKIVVIPNGIDLDRYPAEPAELTPLGIHAGRCVVTFVGRLDAQKGVEWLIETAPAWLAGVPECDLLLVGDGPLRRSLEDACRERGIVDRVHLAGWRPDVPEILAASRLLVLPSAWEGMPNVVLEAMASRIPVVATDVEGVTELLGPAAPHQTVPYGDTEAFVGKLVTLVRDDSLAATMAAENRRRAEERFSLSTMVSAYQELWESLVAG